MIIIGYPGIGKTTLCKHWHKYVDLDSSAFRYNDGTRDKRWAEIYCKVAIDLHNQNYVVFLSSHYEVRDILKKTGIKINGIFPSNNLKDEWINKLKERYVNSKLDKDLRALQFVKNCYETSISEFANSVDNPIIIKNMNYSLLNIVRQLEEEEFDAKYGGNKNDC